MLSTESNPKQKEQILRFLREHHGAVIATVSQEGLPESAYVFYVVDEVDGNLFFYFLTKKSTRKYENVQSNKQISLVVTDEARLVTVQGSGEVTEVLEDAESTRVFDALVKVMMKNIENWPPPVGKMEGDLAVLRVKPAWLRLCDFAEADGFTANEYSVDLS